MSFVPRTLAVVFILLVTVGATLSPAQSNGPAETSAVFRGRTDLVALDVSVEGKVGGPVPPLTASEFLVLENNVPQKVTIFSPAGHMPLAVALLVDCSESMAGERLERAKAAAAAFLHALEPDDIAEILAFNDTADRLSPLSTDHAAAEQSLAGLSARGMTGLYSAVREASIDLDHLHRRQTVDYREAMILFTDGEDTASHERFEDILDDARRSNVAIHVVSLRTDEHDRWLAPAFNVAQLAIDTGGRAVAVRSLADLESIYEGIAADLRQQYRLGYVSSSPASDGQWRQVSVRTLNKDLVARTRAGYFPAR